MNKKDIAQIRRRLNPESQNPVVICGCYVTVSYTHLRAHET